MADGLSPLWALPAGVAAVGALVLGLLLRQAAVAARALAEETARLRTLRPALHDLRHEVARARATVSAHHHRR